VSDDISASIGAAARRARTARGESMRTVAQRAGISQPMLSKIENGQILPSLTTVYGLAAALEIPASGLLPTVGTGAVDPVHFVVDGSGSAPRAQLLSGGAGAPFQVYLVSGRAGEDDGRDFTHAGPEFVHVISGVAELHRADRIDSFAAGDSVTYDGALPHRWSIHEDAQYLLVCET
jgi:HTH-type transcriptional repressor of puuD